MNPYALLGVSPDAPIAVIRKAYRRLAARAHPDHGGSTEAFEALKLAHDILIDPARRERFDRTGDAGETQPDNTIATAMQMVSAVFDEVMMDLAKAGKPPRQAGDLIGRTCRKLLQRKQAARDRLTQIAQGLPLNEALLGRFTAAGAENRMEALIRARVASFHRAREMAEGEICAIDVALEIVQEHVFRADEEAAPVMFQMANFMGSFGGPLGAR